jgi:hypothetical protein
MVLNEIAATPERAPVNGADVAWTIEEINTYFLELERLLDMIERSTTHYETLGVERAVTHEQIKVSYQEAVGLLYPPYDISAGMPDSMLQRVERCFNKSSQAFLTLANFGRRKQYDSALASIASRSKVDSTNASSGRMSAGKTAQQAGEDREAAIKIDRLPAQKEVYKEFSKTSSNDNRRRCERLRLKIPAQAIGWDRKSGKWHEMAETIDVSRTGVTLKLRKSVRYGMVVYLSLPLPAKLRGHGYSEPSYKVYALVRRVEPPKKGARVVALEFLGEHPPIGFLDKPWAVFRTGRWAGSERRRTPREDRFESVVIEYLTEASESILKEEAKTENMSRSGLRVIVRAAPHDFEMVRITNRARSFEGFATVRNRYVAKDGVERLCLQIIDKHWPI